MKPVLSGPVVTPARTSATTTPAKIESIAVTIRVDDTPVVFSFDPASSVVVQQGVLPPLELDGATKLAADRFAHALTQLIEAQKQKLDGAVGAVVAANNGETPVQTDVDRAGVVWKQSVRDSSGRHAHLAGRRFFSTTQPSPDLTSDKARVFLEKSARMRQSFLARIESLPPDLVGFKEMLVELHEIQAYKGKPGALRTFSIQPVELGFLADVLDAAAVRHADAGVRMASITPGNPDGDAGGVAMRKFFRTTFSYPRPDQIDAGLRRAQERLRAALAPEKSPAEAVEAVAGFYFHAIRSHAFVEVNHSLFMNMANTILELHGLEGIEHGVNDFVAFATDERGFARFFAEEVALQNPAAKVVQRATLAELAPDAGAIEAIARSARRTATHAASHALALAALGAPNAPDARVRFDMRVGLVEELSSSSDACRSAWLHLSSVIASAVGDPREAQVKAELEPVLRELERALETTRTVNATFLPHPAQILDDTVALMTAEVAGTFATIEGGGPEAKSAAITMEARLMAAQDLCWDIAFLASSNGDDALRARAESSADTIRRGLDPTWKIAVFAED